MAEVSLTHRRLDDGRSALDNGSGARVARTDTRANLETYEGFFGLSEKPFALTPNPRFVFYSESYAAAEETLLFALAQREGLMLVTGGPGTGKTMLCRTLLEKLSPDRHRVALVSNPHMTGVEMLKTLLAAFGLDSGSSSRKDLFDRLATYCLEQLGEGKTCIVVVDEAQHLSTDCLEQIRVLSNLETPREKLVQIVLVGQMEVLASMRSTQMARLDQRIAVRCTLSALSHEETARYIDHQLNVAGAQGRVRFHRTGLKRLYRATGGVPRLINLTCDRALLAAFAEQMTSIELVHVRHAIASLRLNEDKSSVRLASVARMRKRGVWMWVVGGASTAVAVVVALAFFWFGLDGGAEILAWQGANAASAGDAEQAYVRIARHHPESRQREMALLRLAQLQIAKGDSREALRWMGMLYRDYPNDRGGERQYWMARALLTGGDTLRACSMTLSVSPAAAGLLGSAYASIHRDCDAFAERTRGGDAAGEIAHDTPADTVAAVAPAGSPQPHSTLP